MADIPDIVACRPTGCQYDGVLCPASQAYDVRGFEPGCTSSYADVKTWPNDPCNEKVIPPQCRKDWKNDPKQDSNGSQSKVKTGWQSKTDPPPNFSYTTLDNDDPRKYHISGYAGFVPRTSDKFGTYSVVTRNGMNEFSDARKNEKAGKFDHCR